MSDSTTSQPLLTIAEAAEYLNVSKVTVRRWTNEGRLSCLRIGPRKERRFLRSELDKLLFESGDSPSASAHATGAHQCLVCNDANHEQTAIADAMADHVARGSRIVFIADGEKKLALLRLLVESHGLDTQSLLDKGVIRHLSIEDSYLLSGSFSAAKAIAFIESQILEAHAAGASSQLIVGDSNWIYAGGETQDQSVLSEVWEYEEQLNDLIQRYPGVEVVCPYALDKIDAKAVVNTFMLHPKLCFDRGVVDGYYGAFSSGQRPSLV